MLQVGVQPTEGKAIHNGSFQDSKQMNVIDSV